MARGKKLSGECRVCGTIGPLTFEHVPPEAAYNSEPARTYSYDRWLALKEGGRARYDSQQQGSGYYATCDVCNSTRSGRWYAPEFVDWVRAGAEVVLGIWESPDRENVTGATLKLKGVYPARFVKQVVFMLLAMNGAEFGANHPDLRRFVVEKEATGLPPAYRIYLSLCDVDPARFGGAYVAMKIDESANVLHHVVGTDLLYPPFAYTLTIGEPMPGLREDITRFASLGIDEQVDETLALPFNEFLMPPESMDGIEDGVNAGVNSSGEIPTDEEPEETNERA